MAEFFGTSVWRASSGAAGDAGRFGGALGFLLRYCAGLGLLALAVGACRGLFLLLSG